MSSGAGNYFWFALSGGLAFMVAGWLSIITVRIIRKAIG